MSGGVLSFWIAGGWATAVHRGSMASAKMRFLMVSFNCMHKKHAFVNLYEKNSLGLIPLSFVRYRAWRAYFFLLMRWRALLLQNGWPPIRSLGFPVLWSGTKCGCILLFPKTTWQPSCL